jgi:NosR/NirI family transcriptional regulator, nitrous oxide reductase regulator
VFPDAIQPSELESWVAGELTLDQENQQAIVRDEFGNVTGRVIRTGPLSDDLSGYQGPTELLVLLSPDDKVIDLRIRKSFDNEPYVGYVRTERSFWRLFKGKSLEELSQFDPVAAGVEGVSGATMTSVNVADTLVAAAKAGIVKASQTQAPVQNVWQSIRWSLSEVAVVIVLGLSLVCSQLGIFRRRRWRTAWLVGVVVVIGFGTGNLVSMALVAGWSAEGIAWKLAPGLFAMVAVAFLTPPITKGNPYCNHLCPHGAMQQLIKPSSRSRRHFKLSPGQSRGLTRVPGVLLIVAYLFLIFRPATDLSSWEPFHAYLFRIAGWGSIALAIGSLVIATMIPMAYCRIGCPTGRLFEHLRRSANSDQITLADYVTLGLLGVASWLRWWQ